MFWGNLNPYYYDQDSWGETPAPLRRPYGYGFQQDHIKPRKAVRVPFTTVDSLGAGGKQKKSNPAAAEAKRKSEAAAVRIQAAARGFLTRKNASAVRRIQTEAEEIERRITSVASERGHRWDEKEKLRLGEALMKLVLRLDSVRGVRDYRKRVIRRVIALQELVDSIPAVARSEPAPAVGREEGMEDVPVAEEDSDSDEEMAGRLESLDVAAKELEMEEAEVAVEPEEEKAVEKLTRENRRLERMVEELSERSQEQCRTIEELAGRMAEVERTVARMKSR